MKTMQKNFSCFGQNWFQ